MGLKHRRTPVAERRGTQEHRRKTLGQNDTLKSCITPYGIGIVCLALTAAILHGVHLAVLFENDRFFSHLSPLERELSFRTEMGLYYSYYKTVVVSPSFSEGLERLLNDNTTEYPSTINTLKRFNLYPEVILGGLFRGYRYLLDSLGMEGVTCYTISRGYGQTPIKTCSGLGDLSYFYVYSIFTLNGVLAATLFLIGAYLSKSIVGGLLTLLAFFYNHGEATRVMWTPPLRESFAVPFLMIEVFAVTHTLRHRNPSWPQFLLITVSAVLFLLPWQFSQFTLLTQTLSLLVVYTLRLIPPQTFIVVLSSLGTALVMNILLQFANTLLLTSYFATCLLSCMVVAALHREFNNLKYLPLIAFVEVGVVLLGTVAMKVLFSSLLGSQDDAHIGAILLSKITSYRNFHTQLYTCAAEFDFLAPSYVLQLSLTLLLPGACVVGVMVVGTVMERVREGGTLSDRLRGGEEGSPKSAGRTKPSDHLPEQCYHVVQMAAFAVMAALIMRLKLFLTPQLAILSSLLVVPKVTSFLQTRQRQWLIALVLIGSSLKGFHNLWQEWSVFGEFNDPNQEQLMQWIGNSTTPNAVFAGAMPTMAAVRLSTERPIVNHPHYEDTGLRNRTKQVYTIYSRKPPTEIHYTLSEMGVNYVIVEDIWCNKQYRPGCAFYEVWDEEDPDNRDRPVFCELLQDEIPPPFEIAFVNKIYRVLQVQ